MSQFTNELCGIAAEIANGTYTRKDVKNKLDTLERAYPEETYMVYPVARKEKPWNLAYLKELETLFYSGAASREFLEYMAEVSEDVYRAKRLRRVVAYAALLLALCAAVFALIWKLVRKKPWKR